MTAEGTSARASGPLVSEARPRAPGIGARPDAIVDAWRAERAAYAHAIRMRAIYERARTRMERMDRRDVRRLHYRLKDREADAIEAHRSAERWLRSVGWAALTAREGRA